MNTADEPDKPLTPPAVLKPVARLIDALTDPARSERAMLIVLAVYAAIWTLYGIVAKSSQDVQFDAAELEVVSRDLAFGYAKHPPFAPWLVHGWFSLFPVRDWSYYLLAMTYVAVGLWIAWRLFAHFLDPVKRVVALAFLMLVPYFNFLSLRFDHNAILATLWAATALCFIRSFETRNASWAALAGATAAAAMLGKYWSIFLLAGLALAALTDARRTNYFRSAAPWITIATGLLCLAPHLIWLARHDFISFSYALESHDATTLGQSFLGAARYIAGGAGYAAVPVLIVLALARPGRTALADMLVPGAPERRFVAVAFWTQFLLPAACALAFNFELNAIWTMPGFVLLPVLVLASPLVVLRRQAIVPMVAFAVALPFVMLALSPAIAFVLHLKGVDPTSAHGRLLAQQIEQEWRRTTDQPLRIVGGAFDVAYVVAFYLPKQTLVFPVNEPQNAPLVTPALIAREGAVLACFNHDERYGNRKCEIIPQTAIDALVAANPKARLVEVTITRRYLGVAGKPGRYRIYIIPPPA
jgi:4-amino-4-deoxy-L-arabinose transferase-like glycosyltransferase